MTLNKGWLNRQFDRVSNDVRGWPDWMRREAGFQDDTTEKKVPQQDNPQSVSCSAANTAERTKP